MLDPNLSTSMIQVANKIDKLPVSERKDLENKDFISISASEGTGRIIFTVNSAFFYL